MIYLRSEAPANRWEEQAWVVRLLAAERNLPLDEDWLMLLDVRDLLALRAQLRRDLIGAPAHAPAHWWQSLPLLRRAWRGRPTWG